MSPPQDESTTQWTQADCVERSVTAWEVLEPDDLLVLERPEPTEVHRHGERRAARVAEGFKIAGGPKAAADSLEGLL